MWRLAAIAVLAFVAAKNLRAEDTWIYDWKGNFVGYERDGAIYGVDGTYHGREDDGWLYDRDGDFAGRLDERGFIYDREGRATGLLLDDEIQGMDGDTDYYLEDY